MGTFRQLFLVIFVNIFLWTNACAKRNYDGHQLIELKITTQTQREFMKKLSDLDIQLDIWSEGQDSFDVLVPPQRLDLFNKQISAYGISYKIKSDNIQKDIEIEEQRLTKRGLRNGNKLPIDYDDYNTYEAIISELDDLVKRCPLQLTCETVVHGVSSENRDIKGIRVYRAGSVQKKIWIDATIHAREWLATAVNLKIISNIVDNYEVDAELRELVDRYDWYLLPVLNVDGYSFTWTDDRLWRKNRTPNNLPTCPGTDLNRNFNHMWGNAGSSVNPCSQTYQGSAPGSELETQALQNALNAMSSDLLMSVNLHTYGRMWLTPWGFENPDRSCYVGVDSADQLNAANAAADAVERTHNTVWTRGPFCTVLYPGSGTSIDYAKGVAGLKYAFLPELRGTHFIEPPTQIQPGFEETWNGIKAAIAYIEAGSD